jgi:SAM-dependent methyltransferase
MNIKSWIPWWGKLGAKIVLSRLPIDYRSWARLGIFKLGEMVDPGYALGVFRFHWKRANLALDRKDELTLLELGPGDSLLSGPIAKSFGAGRCLLLDIGDFASRKLEPFHRLVDRLAAEGGDVSSLRGCRNWDEILARCNAQYLTGGLESLRQIPAGSVDLIWSQAVLEHIPRKDFLAIMCELRRILSKNGRCSHTVDLTDHLGGGLNNLRFSDKLWESRFFSSSGFYTNRIRYEEMLNIFRVAGFSISSLERKMWKTLPISKDRLDDMFASVSQEDLLTFGFDVVLSQQTIG